MDSYELAGYIVTTFNALTDSPISFTALRPSEVATVEKEASDFTVHVVAVAESEEPFDNGDGCTERLQCAVIVQGPITTSLTLANAIAFLKFLRRGLRETSYDDDDDVRYDWQGNEATTIYDEKALVNDSQYSGSFLANYMGAA